MHFDRRIYVQGAMYRHYIPCSSVRAVEKFIAETQRRIRPSCPSPPPPLIATESVVSSPRLVVRKYYSSEKKKSPAPSSEDSKLLRAFNRVDFQRRVAKLSAISLIIFSSNRDLPNFIPLYLFARNFLIDSKGKFNLVKEKKKKEKRKMEGSVRRKEGVFFTITRQRQ